MYLGWNPRWEPMNDIVNFPATNSVDTDTRLLCFSFAQFFLFFLLEPWQQLLTNVPSAQSQDQHEALFLNGGFCPGGCQVLPCMAFVGVCRWFMWFLSPLSRIRDISNRPFGFFLNFDMVQLEKILLQHWKERLKISKTDKFESDTS